MAYLAEVEIQAVDGHLVLVKNKTAHLQQYGLILLAGCFFLLLALLWPAFRYMLLLFFCVLAFIGIRGLLRFTGSGERFVLDRSRDRLMLNDKVLAPLSMIQKVVLRRWTKVGAVTYDVYAVLAGGQKIVFERGIGAKVNLSATDDGGPVASKLAEAIAAYVGVGVEQITSHEFS